MTDTSREAVERKLRFLCGAGPDENGRWFDDVGQHQRGAFWWRTDVKELVHALLAERTALDRLIEEAEERGAQRERERIERNLGAVLAGQPKSLPEPLREKMLAAIRNRGKGDE